MHQVAVDDVWISRYDDNWVRILTPTYVNVRLVNRSRVDNKITIGKSNSKWPCGFFLSDDMVTSCPWIRCNAYGMRQHYIFSSSFRKSSTAHSSCHEAYEPYTVLDQYSEIRVRETLHNRDDIWCISLNSRLNSRVSKLEKYDTLVAKHTRMPELFQRIYFSINTTLYIKTTSYRPSTFNL